MHTARVKKVKKGIVNQANIFYMYVISYFTYENHSQPLFYSGNSRKVKYYKCKMPLEYGV